MSILNWILCGKNVLVKHIIEEKHVPMWKFKLLDDSRLTWNKLKMETKPKSPQG